MYHACRIVIAIIILAAVASASDFPHLISYQGRVTDNANAPITNPTASMEFRLFNAAAGGTQVWNESGTVAVTDGLFTHVLGSTCPACSIPSSVFKAYDTLWLEVVYAGQVMTPRTRLVASPYAYRVSTVDQATGGAISGEVTISGNSNGNQLEVNNSGLGRGGFFSIGNGSNTEAAVQGTHVGSGPGGSFFSDGGGPGLRASATFGTAAEFSGDLNLGGDLFVVDGVDTVGEFNASGNILRNFGDDGLENWRLWGSGYGELQLNDNSLSNLQQVELSAFNGGGSLTLHDWAGANDKILNASGTGDGSVILGANAVNASEILDEPGVASHKDPSGSSVGMLNTTLLTRTINCPTAGYVVALSTGRCYFNHKNDSLSQVYIWITEFAGSNGGKPQLYLQLPPSAATGQYLQSWSIHGVFDVPAGNTTFYLQARNTSVDLPYTELNNLELTLIFIPTAYGSVTSSAPPTESNNPALRSYPGLSEPATAEQIATDRLAQDVAKMQQQIEEMKEALATMQQANRTASAVD